MDDRRSFLSILTAVAASAQDLRGQAPRQTRTVGAFPLPPPFDKQTANLVELYLTPGTHSVAHKHPGFVLGYVIEGEFRFQVAGEPERVLRSGDTFYEQPGAVHVLGESASPSLPARVLAIVIAPSDQKKLSEPA